MRFLPVLSDRGLYIFTILGSIGLLSTLGDMPLYSKMFPAALLVILIALSVASLVVMRKKYASIDLTKFKASYAIYALFTAYLAAMPFAGYLAATTVFLLAAMLLLKPKASKILVTVVSVAFAGALSIGFANLLQVPLP